MTDQSPVAAPEVLDQEQVLAAGVVVPYLAEQALEPEPQQEAPLQGLEQSLQALAERRPERVARVPARRLEQELHLLSCRF